MINMLGFDTSKISEQDMTIIGEYVKRQVIHNHKKKERRRKKFEAKHKSMMNDEG